MELVGDIPTSFVETLFDPVEYNSTYFATIMQDEAALIEWLVASLPSSLSGASDSSGQVHLLDVGCGPTVHRMLAFEPFITSLTLADFMAANLEEIERWRRRDPDAHDWTHFTVAIQDLERRLHGTEGSPNPRDREAALRARITGLATVDLRRARSLRTYSGHQPHAAYEVVTSFFCADSATADHDEFAGMVANAIEYVRPGGSFIGSALGGCSAYRVGEQWLPSPNLGADEIANALRRAGLVAPEIVRFETPDLASDGFDHIYAFAGTYR